MILVNADRFKIRIFDRGERWNSGDHMRAKLVSGLFLLSWQAAVIVLSLLVHFDMLLANWPDPGWYVVLYTALLAPPGWLVVAAAGLGLFLIWSGLRDRAAISDAKGAAEVRPK